jgi:peptidoglycan/xylan/chitin deacetylase (PgdA/CDA1 family)
MLPMVDRGLRLVATVVLLGLPASLRAQQNDPDYLVLRSSLSEKYSGLAAGKFGAFTRRVAARIKTDQKIVALTFDACGGPRGNGYDKELIDFLLCERIPATLFLTGRWIDDHPREAKQLAADTLFDIENHGLFHRPCSLEGRSKYGIEGTCNIGDAIDEIEINARKIECLTNVKPVYYRSATAMSDEGCATLADVLGETIVSYDVLSGDAVARTAVEAIASNVVNKVRNGSIVIMHMNHPEWNGYEALTQVVPALRKQGYTFVKLRHHSLQGKP